MAQGPSDTILVAIRITLQIQESKVRNPDAPDRRRFVVPEHIYVLCYVMVQSCGTLMYVMPTHTTSTNAVSTNCAL